MESRHVLLLIECDVSGRWKRRPFFSYHKKYFGTRLENIVTHQISLKYHGSRSFDTSYLRKWNPNQFSINLIFSFHIQLHFKLKDLKFFILKLQFKANCKKLQWHSSPSQCINMRDYSSYLWLLMINLCLKVNLS